jgi:AbrB family looped-hinge helix DNA binding protein
MMMEEVTIGRRGSITLPAKIRKQYGLQERDKLIVEETDQGLLLRPAVSMPIELYSEERIAEFTRDDKAIGEMLNDLDADKP